MSFKTTQTNSTTSNIMDQAETVRTLHTPGLSSRILSNMLDSTDPSLFDLTVTANGKDFLCHRAVLSASSPVFSAMFLSEMKEKQTGHLNLPIIRADVFSAIRLYLYGQPLRVTQEIALPVSSFARSYQIGCPDLPDFLDALLASALTLENIHAVRAHADAHSAYRLRRHCDRFLAARMSQLHTSSAFLACNPEDAKAALKVSQTHAVTRTAQHALQAAIAWLSVESLTQSRIHLLEEMLSIVQVDQLSLPALVRASREPMILTSSVFQAKLLRAFAKKAEQDLNFGHAPPKDSQQSQQEQSIPKINTPSLAGIVRGPATSLLARSRAFQLDILSGEIVPQHHGFYTTGRRRTSNFAPFVHDRFSRQHHGVGNRIAGYYGRDSVSVERHFIEERDDSSDGFDEFE